MLSIVIRIASVGSLAPQGTELIFFVAGSPSGVTFGASPHYTAQFRSIYIYHTVTVVI